MKSQPICVLLLVFQLILTKAGLALDSDQTEKARRNLQKVRDAVVEKDDAYRNCLMAVCAGDGSFVWAGAAGLADPGANRIISVETPFYLASITKLLTAVVVMQLIEEEQIELSSKMADILLDSVIHGIHNDKGHDYTTEIQIQHLISHSSGIPDYYEKVPKNGKFF